MKNRNVCYLLLIIRKCVLGGEATGKSSLLARFLSDSFDQSYEPTVGKIFSLFLLSSLLSVFLKICGAEYTHRKTMLLEGEECQLELLDTSGTSSEFTSK